MVFIARKRKDRGHNLAPTYKIFVAFSMCTSQNTLKTKDTKQEQHHCRTMLGKRPGKKHLTVALCQENGWEKTPHIPKMAKMAILQKL